METKELELKLKILTAISLLLEASNHASLPTSENEDLRNSCCGHLLGD